MESLIPDSSGWEFVAPVTRRKRAHHGSPDASDAGITNGCAGSARSEGAARGRATVPGSVGWSLLRFQPQHAKQAVHGHGLQLRVPGICGTWSLQALRGPHGGAGLDRRIASAYDRTAGSRGDVSHLRRARHASGHGRLWPDGAIRERHLRALPRHRSSRSRLEGGAEWAGMSQPTPQAYTPLHRCSAF